MVGALCDLGNPFSEESGQLIELDGSVIMRDEVVDAVKNAITLGTEQYKDFFAKRIDNLNAKKIVWNAPIHKNSLKLLGSLQKTSGEKSVVACLKEERCKVIQCVIPESLCSRQERSPYLYLELRRCDCSACSCNEGLSNMADYSRASSLPRRA